jgi:hypothetical protein
MSIRQHCWATLAWFALFLVVIWPGLSAPAMSFSYIIGALLLLPFIWITLLIVIYLLISGKKIP